MIETTAIMIGTIARNDAKTKASTISAPNPPSSASSEDAGAVVAAARLLEGVEAGQVDRGAAHGRAGDRGLARPWRPLGCRRTAESGSGVG